MSVDVQKIHEASMEILKTTGVKFHHPDAVEVLKEHGIQMDGDVAHFTEEQIMKYVEMAPASVSIHAKNPKYDIALGSGVTYNAPCAGATEIMEKDGTIRQADLKDLVRMIQLFETNEDYLFNGGTPCQPKEIPSDIASVFLHYIAMGLTEKTLWTACGDYKQMETIMKMTMARYSITEEELRAQPRLFTMVNTNTPLQFDINMTETLFTYLKYRQPIAITAAAMGGTTAPVTLAGELAVLNAEVISVVALSQMFAPGAPVVYGSQSTNADMKSCSIAVGSPEGALCYKYAKKMAAFYGIPCRAGGALSDAKIVNAQAGYESMLTYLSCRLAGVDVVFQSAGIMDGDLAASFEKILVGFEIIRFVNRYMREFEVDTETLALEVVEEVGPAGQYLMEEHTLDYCREELCIPALSVRGPQENGAQVFDDNLKKQMQMRLDSYQKPVLSAEEKAAVKAVMEEFGIEESFMGLADAYI